MKNNSLPGIQDSNSTSLNWASGILYLCVVLSHMLNGICSCLPLGPLKGMAERGGALVMPQIRRGTTPVIILLISLLLSCQSKEKVKFHQYYVQGEQLYLKHCSNCHKADGEGLRLLYPPVSRSDFMDNNFAEVICLMKYGRSGEMEVNGKNFNQPMPGVPTLTELELAEIATFIYNTWEHDRGLVEINEISSSLSKCAPE